MGLTPEEPPSYWPQAIPEQEPTPCFIAFLGGRDTGNQHKGLIGGRTRLLQDPSDRSGLPLLWVILPAGSSSHCQEEGKCH